MTIPETPSPDKSPDRITGAKPLEADQAIRQSSKGTGFESYMQQGSAPKGTTETPGALTPMDITRPSNMRMEGPTTNSLLAQAKVARDSLGTVEGQLNTPNLKFKRSQAHLLKNKLTDAQTYSRTAAAKLGVETPPMKPPAGSSPLDRFLSYVGDGQDQFLAIQKKLQDMAAAGKPIHPADMMLVQSKMALAQQEIEYSSTLLSKVISSITTIMGIQL